MISVVSAIIIIAIVLVIVIIQTFGPKKIIRTYGDGYTDGYTAARNAAYLLAPQLQPINKSILSGTVTNTSDDSIAFTASGLLMDARVDGVGMDRTAHVTKDTIIVRQEKLTPDEIAQANEAFQAKVSNQRTGQTPPTPPAPYKETTIRLSDIKPGDRITVISEKGEDILASKSFNVSKVSVNPGA